MIGTRLSQFLTRFSGLLLLWLATAMARADFDAAQFQRDLHALAASPTRSVGSPGCDAAIDYVLAQAGALPGVQVRVQRFDVMTPQTTSAALTLSDGTRADVFPLFPAGIRLNATPAGGLQGKLVYCGAGQIADIPCRTLDGNIAVLEASDADQWKSVAGFGARAILMLGSPSVSHVKLRSNETFVPVNVPRFYVPDGPLAERLRRGTDLQGSLQAVCNWKSVSARNVYAYIAPKDPLPLSTQTQSTPQPWAALTVVAPVDATGLVPDRSPGAGQAVQPAAALSLLRELAHHPPRRPVLICFTGADSYDLMGTRQLLMSLADPPAKWRKAIEETLDPQLDEVRRELKTAESLHGDPTRLDPVADRELIASIVKIVETDVAVEQDELFALRVASRSPGMSTAEAERTRTLEDRQIRLNQIKYGFQSAPQSLNTFGDAPRQYLKRAIQRLGGAAGRDGLLQQLSDRKAALQERAALYEWLADRIGRNRNPDLRDNDERLLEIMIGIDLSDRGRRVGPIAWGRLYGQQSIGQVQEYREWMQRLAAPGAAAAEWFAPLKGKIDFEPAKLIRSQASYLTAPLALPTELGAAWGIPALTMATLEDLRPRRDTPLDTLDRLDVPAILPQAAALQTLLTHAFDAPDFLGQPEFRRNNNEYEGQVVSTASGRPIPDLPREGFLATHYYLNADRKIPLIKSMPYALGVRRSEVRDCDSEGRYYFDGEPKVADLKKLVTKVYRIESGTGAISASTDLGGGSSGVSTVVNLDASIDPVKSVVFNSREATIVGLYDPRYLQWLGEVQFIDARRNAEPQRFDAIVGDAMMEANLEPGSRNDVLFRYGRIGNRIVLLNLPDPKSANAPTAQAHSEGRGYTVDQLNHIVPLPLVTARDFWRLNDVRIEQYRKAGVTSALIDNMHAHAADELRNAEHALQSDDTAALLKASTGAWADEARVYDAAQKMANDVIYAAIFLLLLAVPFSFCMERLTIGTANIYKQIAGSCGYFGVMALALWLFHPAFKISSSPLIIILAFAIIFMSLIVIGVVYGKFDAELKRIRSGRGVGEGTRFASASVMMSAIMLGIANMRRRKFRTVLTATTVVLITFAVLCFTSSSRYQGIVALPTGVDPAYPGLLLRQRGYRPIATEAIASLHAAFPDLKFVERWWTANPSDAKDQIELVSPTAVVAVPAMLGLSPGESELSAIRDVIPNYDRLERGETNVIYLPIPIARQLKVKQGDTLSLAGRQLQVAGIYDPTAFDQRVMSLAGDSLAPLKYSTGAIDASGGRLTDSNSDTLDLDADSSAAEAGSSYEHLPATQFAIAPAKALEGLDYTSLKSIGVRVASASQSPAERDAAVKKMVEQTTQRFAMATFAGYSDGVKLVSASNLASIGGGANVMIPLAIGGLIIFNTMMGSIAERKREIHVYTSLGLAPLHVGALFVAEAMTYGLIGSVFGYIIGQGIGTALLKLGWLGNVTLNYSGTSAMLTLGLILLIVFLSALVPARLASKIAAPSIDRAWRVPAPKDNRIIADLPFTINQTAAEGVIGYLFEFFEQHQEGSIGKFSAGKIESFASTGADGQPTRGLKTIIWLTPFDLGVRQHLLLLIHPGEFREIYEVQVVLECLSGDTGSWWRMNRSFLTELRKQFLQWRSLSPQRMKEYVDQSHALFADVPRDVVTTSDDEVVRLA